MSCLSALEFLFSHTCSFRDESLRERSLDRIQHSEKKVFVRRSRGYMSLTGTLNPFYIIHRKKNHFKSVDKKFQIQF